MPLAINITLQALFAVTMGLPSTFNELTGHKSTHSSWESHFSVLTDERAWVLHGSAQEHCQGKTHTSGDKTILS